MERKTKQQLCEALAIDYAYRAKPALGVDFADAYQYYLDRCMFREYDDVLHQYKQGPLKTDSKAVLVENNKEYVEPKASDDDCGDSCKL